MHPSTVSVRVFFTLPFNDYRRVPKSRDDDTEGTKVVSNPRNFIVLNPGVHAVSEYKDCNYDFRTFLLFEEKEH